MKAVLKQYLASVKRLSFRLLPNPRYRKAAGLLFVSLLIAFFVAGSESVSAQFGDIADGIIAGVTWLILQVATIFIQLAIFFLRFFITVAGYNNYINAPVVLVGWNMVRDVANMFFVVILMVIAFGTILGLEQYEWRKSLVKLIIAAIFVNFSNLILQLIIDAAQVFTITFLNAVASTAGGNLIQIFNFEKIFELAVSSEAGDRGSLRLEVFGAAVMALVFAAIAMMMIFWYCITVLLRMVFLWVAIILSPLAFILSVLPQTKKYADEFWNEFVNHVLVAPIMVFFLWLAFGTFGTTTLQHIEQDHGLGSRGSLSKAESQGTIRAERPGASFNRAATWENMANFAVAIAFLFVGIDRVGKIGATGGGLAQGAINFGKNVATIASGYAAGRWLYEGGSNLASKGIGGAIKHAPVIGTEKWKRRFQIQAEAIKGYYYGKGYELTEEGEQIRDEIERDSALLSHAKDGGTRLSEEVDALEQAKQNASTDAQRKAIEEQLAGKKDMLAQVGGMSQSDIGALESKIKGQEQELMRHMGGRGVGRVVGWMARDNIKLQKRLAKTEKQAGNRRQILWKRTGSQAGGYLVGMGRKGIFGGFLGDRYAGRDAQDRIEEGWLMAEQMRSKAKDEEFHARGRKEVLTHARVKFDVNSGELKLEFGKGTMAERIAERKAMANLHTASITHAEDEAWMQLTRYGKKMKRDYGASEIEGVQEKGGRHVYDFDHVSRAMAQAQIVKETMQDIDQRRAAEKRTEAMGTSLYQRLIEERTKSNLERLAVQSSEQGDMKLADFAERLEATELDNEANEIEKEANGWHSAGHEAAYNQIRARKQRISDEQKWLQQQEDILMRLELGHGFDVNNDADQELLQAMGISPSSSQDDVDMAVQIMATVPDASGQTAAAARRAAFEARNQAFTGENGELKQLEDEIMEFAKQAAEADNADAALKERKEDAFAQAEAIRVQSRAWRYAASRARENMAVKLDLTSNTGLLAAAEQRVVYDQRGVDTPNDAYGELAEMFRSSFSKMPVQAYVGNLAPMLKKNFGRRSQALGAAAEKLDRAVSLGLGLRGFDGAWWDDNDYGLRMDDETKQIMKEYFGWDPRDQRTTLGKLGVIQGNMAYAGDLEHVSKEAFVRQLMEQAQTKHKLSMKEIFEGLRTGTFKTPEITDQLRVDMEATRALGGKQLEHYEVVFGQSGEDRQAFYDAFMDKIRDSQGELEVLGNLRDDAISKSHAENAGHYQKFEVADGESLYIPVGASQARDYVLGDQKKTDVRLRVKGHFHEWADRVEQGGSDRTGNGFGQGLFEIDETRYAALRGDITDFRKWDDTRKRNKLVLAGLMAADDVADFRSADGYFELGGPLTVTGKKSGSFAMYRNALPERFRGSFADQRHAHVQELLKRNFIKQLKHNPRDLLYALGQAAGVDAKAILSEGTIRLRLNGQEYDTINDLIGAINAGDFGSLEDLGLKRQLAPMRLSGMTDEEVQELLDSDDA